MEQFDFRGSNVRVVMRDNEPCTAGRRPRSYNAEGATLTGWFALTDVCKVLEVRPDNAKAKLNRVDSRTAVVKSGRQNRRMGIVNESGLYDVILDSHKPQAKQFLRWAETVLAELRSGGAATSIAKEEDTNTSISPFDRIKQTREDGTEYWSARDLAPLMGYTVKWQNFKNNVIGRAMRAAENQGQTSLFTEVSKKSNGGRDLTDFELTRFAAYLVAMNGDPNKAEVAAAQAYFAINTYENEVRRAQESRALPQNFSEALRLLADSEEIREHEQTERKRLEALREQDAPKVWFADSVEATSETITLTELSKLIDSVAGDMNVRKLSQIPFATLHSKALEYLG